MQQTKTGNYEIVNNTVANIIPEERLEKEVSSPAEPIDDISENENGEADQQSSARKNDEVDNLLIDSTA